MIKPAGGGLYHLEVVGGFEPPWTALQAAAWPLGYTTVTNFRLRSSRFNKAAPQTQKLISGAALQSLE